MLGNISANSGGKYTMAVAVSLTGVEAHRIRRYEEAGLLSRCGQKEGSVSIVMRR